MSLPDPQGTRAVLIGAHTGFARLGGLEDLDGVEGNLAEFRRVLTDGTVWSLPEEHCVHLPQPSDERTVLAAVRKAAHEATDTLLVYFTGHGTKIRDDLYLALPDKDEHDECLSFAKLHQRVLQAPASTRTIIILDCCYSGAAIKGRMGAEQIPPFNLDEMVGPVAQAEGACILASSLSTRTSRANPGERFTVYSGALLDVLINGVPGPKPYLRISDVHAAVKKSLGRLPLISPPQFNADDLGADILFAPNHAQRPDAPEPTTQEETAAPEPAREESRSRARRIADRRPVIGINFGTATCTAAHDNGRAVHLVQVLYGRGPDFPSIVTAMWTGRRVEDPKGRLRTAWTWWAGLRRHTAAHAAAEVLGNLRLEVVPFLALRGYPPLTSPLDAVIAVPDGFPPQAREDILQAAKQAGFGNVGLIDETVAAAAYRVPQDTAVRTALVFSLGASHLSVSVQHIGPDIHRVLASTGEDGLGGRAWDHVLARHLSRLAADRHDLSDIGDYRGEFLQLAEAAKIKLSGENATRLRFGSWGSDFVNGPVGGVVVSLPKHEGVVFEHLLTRLEFEQISGALVDRCETLLRDVLEMADTGPEQIDLTILAGESTRMPMIHELLRKLGLAVNLDEGAVSDAIVKGAAFREELLTGHLGVLLADGAFAPLAEHPGTGPSKKTRTLTTSHDGQRELTVALQVRASDDPRRQILGHFSLTGIDWAERGVPRIEIRAERDSQGILAVTATEQATGRREGLVLTASEPLRGGLAALPSDYESSLPSPV